MMHQHLFLSRAFASQQSSCHSYYRCSHSLLARRPCCCVVNNGGIGRRIIFSRCCRGPEYPVTGPGSLSWPAVCDSQQAAFGETDQTRKVGLGRRRAAYPRAEARQHRPRVKRGSVLAAPARGGGETQAAERCGFRLQ